MTATARSGDATVAGDRWSVWGTYACLAVARPDALPDARRVADELLERVGRACSRFRDDSDLTVANRHAGQWVEADPLLVAALRAALWAADLTDGAVDPCLGRALVCLGYDDDLALVGRPAPASHVAPPLPPQPGAWREVEVADDAVRVPAGVALDLGATGKAWAADLVAETVADAVGVATAVSLGGDVRVAGPRSSPSSDPTWRVRVTEHVDDPGGELVAVCGGLATSTTLVRRWRTGGADRHHLLDPATGLPAAGPYRTVTAAGRTCLAANTASTAAVVLGERAPRWLASRGVTARLVAADGAVSTVGGWPTAEHLERSS